MLRTVDAQQADGRDCQMHMVKLVAALGALTLSSLALADTHFECGTVACSAFGNQPITGIDNLVVDGDNFNVIFSNTQDTTFLFSSHTAAPGQPLTGVDAANALDAFYATQKGPIPQDDGPGILAQVGGVDVEVFNVVTAYQASSTPGIFNLNVTQPFLGGGYPGPTLVAPDVGDNSPSAGQGPVVTHAEGICFGACTVWTPIVAPEISLVSAPAELTLLLGCLAVLRGRRPCQRQRAA
jgi:hypothetical protein